MCKKSGEKTKIYEQFQTKTNAYQMLVNKWQSELENDRHAVLSKTGSLRLSNDDFYWLEKDLSL